MNVERLLRQYGRIMESPNAVIRLRRFILNLAVCGKLVPQNPDDEPALELLKKIAKEKARLIEAGHIRNEKLRRPLSEDDQPTILPLGWAWTRLGNLIHLVSGQHLQPTEYSVNSKAGLPYITGPSDFAAEGLKISRFALVRKAVAKKGQLLLTVKGSGVGKTTTCDIPEVAISRQLMALTAIAWDSRFLVLITHRLAEKLQEQARSLIPGISREDVEEFVFPLPPLAEQGRIVAKVGELMALCDQLEKARTAREETRDRLTAASLARLNDPAPETFQTDACFALDALPWMTARPDQIKQLRQTILNLAVRGKLVPQDPNDEPASEALRRIAAETPHLSEHDEIRKPFPFTVSDGWRWTRLGNVVGHSDAGWSPKTENHPRVGNNWGVLKVSAVSWGKFRDWENKEVLAGTTPRLQAKINKGDFLISRANTAELVARAVIVEEEPVNLMMSDKIVRLKLSANIDHRYVLIVNNDADFARRYYAEQASGVSPSMKNVSREVILKLPLPLPPLPEQERIVAKVDELMAVCDRLEASLVAGETARSRSLEALLHEALEPSVDRLEAAA